MHTRTVNTSEHGNRTNALHAPNKLFDLPEIEDLLFLLIIISSMIYATTPSTVVTKHGYILTKISVSFHVRLLIDLCRDY